MSRACKFFLSGNCRNGAACPFRHDQAATTPTGGQGAPMMVHIEPGTPILSIDVECAATSTGHNGRAVCSIGIVDEYCRPVVRILVKPEADKPVVSYLGPITGVLREDVDANGISFEDAVARVRSHLGPNTVIIGQNILKDTQWLHLVEGTDYKHLIDLTALFRVWNMQRQSWTNFSQDHIAKVWLSIHERPSHDALDDAVISMSLLNAYRSIQHDPERLYYLQMSTLNAPRTVSYAAMNGSIEGCCLGNRKTCTCGEPFFIS